MTDITFHQTTRNTRRSGVTGGRLPDHRTLDVARLRASWAAGTGTCVVSTSHHDSDPSTNRWRYAEIFMGPRSDPEDADLR